MPILTSTLIFAGGGSGGHIYPGLAIAEQIQTLAATEPAARARCLFVCSDRPLDQKILKDAQAEFEISPAKPVRSSVKGMLAFASGWTKSVWHAKRVIKQCRKTGPVHVVAMGGFVSAPFVHAARKAKCPVTMVNLDSVPGKANRWIAPRVAMIFSAAPVPDEFKPRTQAFWMDVPPIVRAQARSSLSRAEARSALGLDPGRPVLMVTGGSQGLRSVNEFVTAFAGSPAGARSLAQHRWQVLHQTGKNLDQAAADAYRAAGIDAKVVPFTDQMGLWWTSADLAICTAGAGNVAEIWCNKTPALLLPYPHHKDQHQKYNAAALEKAGGVVVGVDRITPADNLQQNAATLEELLATPARRDQMRAALEKLGQADGAERIARALLDALRVARAAI